MLNHLRRCTRPGVTSAFSRGAVRNISVDNKHPPSEVDAFFHLGLTSADDVQARFGDVKFFCTGGSAARIRLFAQKMANALQDVPGVNAPPFGSAPVPIGKTDRFEIYKVGPVLMANHGMGMPTTSILLHEVTKLLAHAGASDPLYVRMGTSGGIGAEAGTVVVTTEGVNGLLQPEYTLAILGEPVTRPSIFDAEVAEAIVQVGQEQGIPMVKGRTMGTDCFYEGQARLDGAVCEYTEAQKMQFLQKAFDTGVRNMEMESPVFGAFTHRLNIRAACVCVSLLDRLKGDQHYSSEEDLAMYDERPGEILVEYIKSSLTAK